VGEHVGLHAGGCGFESLMYNGVLIFVFFNNFDYLLAIKYY